MSKPKVSIVRCDDYNAPDLYEKVCEAASAVLNADALIKHGTKVLLKPNLLFGTPPERAVTTHPQIVRAVGEFVKDRGGELWIGDSSGYGSCARNMRLSGIEQVAKELGAKIIPFTEPVDSGHADLKYARNFRIEKAVLEADVLINLPKLKTHGLTYFTGAAKNLFGCLPGLQKGKTHVRLPDRENFSAMLVELNRIIKPQLSIMDAVVGMEGSGPGSGDPRKVGLILAGVNTFAVDVVACEIIGLPPHDVPNIRMAAEQKLGPESLNDISILGEKIEDIRIPDFKLREPADGLKRLKHFFMKVAGKVLRTIIFEVPDLKTKKCNKCFRCAEVCPIEAVRKSARGPVFDYKSCIRCYCCQEMCPEGAIKLKRKLIF
ncbi:MAG: DUF362 domain-containing protein [Planctomycetota bacterium]|nr:MAG: DUF362 domain-containing protein [Planctomycetota bacterium]